MATILLVGAGLLLRTVVSLLRVPVGFDTARVVTARMTLPRPNEAARATYLDPPRRVEFSREILRRVSALPGVERAALTTQIPLGGFAPPLFVELDGADPSDVTTRPVVHNFQVSTGYFGTMGIRLVRGRAFVDLDGARGEPVAIVSESAVRALWRGSDPVGRRVRFSADTRWMTVIGVAADVLNRRLTEEPQPILYRPLEQSSDLSLALVVRTQGDRPGIGAAIAREVRAVDPQIPVYAVRTMGEVIEAGVVQRQFVMRILFAFGAVATGLALLGIYGVMAYSVSQRTREIGIRMAIGAQQRDVSWMVLRNGLGLTVGGAVVGVLASLALSRFAESQLFGVKPWDPLTMLSVLAIMIGVAAGAAYLPARRAALVDPVTALRGE